VQASSYGYRYPSNSGGKGPSSPYGYAYRDDNKNDAVKISDEELLATIGALGKQIDLIKAPQGKLQNNPARSCKDIFLNNADAESGYYWVDPNLGCIEDAVQVYCEAETQATCVPAQNSVVTNGTWYVGKTKRTYFSSMNAGDKLHYIEDPTQMTFLRLLSTNARQRVTYYCKNIAGNPIFLSSSDVELVDDETSKFNYRIIEDGCSTSSSQWGKAVYEYDTKKTTRLPIVDFAPGEVGLESQMFGMEMGPVCFS